MMAPRAQLRWQSTWWMAGLGMTFVCICASYTTSRAIDCFQQFGVLESVAPPDSRQPSQGLTNLDDSFSRPSDLAIVIDDDDNRDAYGYYIFNSRGVIRPGRKRRMEWVNIDLPDVPKHFTTAELDSVGFDYDAYLNPQVNASTIFGRERVCKLEDKSCCLGSKSSGGEVGWRHSICTGQQVGRGYFRRYWPAAGEQPRTLFRMPDVLRLLSNRTLSFVGDSIMVQVATGAKCDWRRHSVPIADAPSTDPTSSATADRSGEEAVIIRSRTSRNYSPPLQHMPPNVSPDFWLFGMTEVKLSLELEGTMSTVKSVRMYRPVPDMSNVLEQMTTSDVMIINFGLHMRNMGDMANVSRGLLEALMPYAARRDKVVMWRETSSQHHFSDGGEWPPNPSTYPGTDLDVASMEFSKAECKPHAFRNESVLRMWRDRVLYQTALDLGYTLVRMDYQDEDGEFEGPDGPRLYILPFFEATAELWEHHDANQAENGAWHCEATHFCHTPYVWEHVYDAAYRALVTAGF